MPTRRGTAVTLVAGGAAAIVLAPRALALLARLDRLLADVERLVRRMNGAMTTVEETSVRAGEVVAEAQAGLRRLETALRPYEGLLGQRLPDVLRRVEEDLVPALDTLGRVGPDVRDVLETVDELRTALGSIPAMQLLRKRRGGPGGVVRIDPEP
jgi:hypothetical protein